MKALQIFIQSCEHPFQVLLVDCDVVSALPEIYQIPNCHNFPDHSVHFAERRLFLFDLRMRGEFKES